MTKTKLKVEVYKSICNPFFVSALIIGGLFSLVNVTESILRARKLSIQIIDTIRENIGYPISASFEGISLFLSWLPLHRVGLGSSLFFMAMPILAAMPYGWSYSDERHSGYIYQTITRMGKQSYFFSKYLSVFLSGGLAVLIPLIFDLLLTALFCPDVPLQITDMLTPILNYSLFGELFYTNRWLYVISLCSVEFLWGGSIACMTFFAGTVFRYGVLIVIMPFVVLLSVDYLSMIASGIIASFRPIQILQLCQPVSTYYNPGWLSIAVPCSLILLSFCFGYIHNNKNELV